MSKCSYVNNPHFTSFSHLLTLSVSSWTDGDYDYAVLAYGAGGDTDYGLNAEDLATVLADIQ